MDRALRQVIEAVYTQGVLRPLRPVDLRESEQVRLVIEKTPSTAPQARAALVARFRDGVERMGFRSNGSYPSRDELHDRH